MAALSNHKQPDFTAAQYRSLYAHWSHAKITGHMDLCRSAISRANRDIYFLQTKLVLARVELDNSGYYSPRELHPTQRQLELLRQINKLEHEEDGRLEYAKSSADRLKWYQLELVERMEYRPPFTAAEAADVASMWARIARDHEEDAVCGMSYLEEVAEYAVEQAEIAARELGAVARKAAGEAAAAASAAMECAGISKEWNNIAEESAARAKRAAAEAEQAARIEARGHKER